MSPIPPTFVRLHKIAGLTDTQVAERWGNIHVNTAKELLYWLLETPLLSTQQKSQLALTCKRLANATKPKHILQDIRPILKAAQVEAVADKYSEFLVKNISNTYARLNQNASPDQKQVIRSYLKVVNV
jgi:hypothetical protein